MYINPFLAGVLATLLAEFVFAIMFALLSTAKDGKDENNDDL